MKTTGLYGVGLLATIVAMMVSCSDDAGTTNTTTGGTSTTAGTTSGGTTSAGTSSGGTNSGAGTNSTAGTNATAGTNNPPQGGDGNDPGGGGNGNEPMGGAGNAGEECPAAAPEDGSECDRPGGFQTPPCTYGDVECRCQGQQNREWNCQDGGGNEGGGPGLGTAECPADAMDGDPCTGQGLCTGQQCFCDGEETQCF